MYTDGFTQICLRSIGHRSCCPDFFPPFFFFFVVFSIFNYIKWNRKQQRDSRERNRNVTIRASGKDSSAFPAIIATSNWFISFRLSLCVLVSLEKEGNAESSRTFVIIFTIKTSRRGIDFLAPIYKPISEQNNNNNNDDATFFPTRRV